MSRARDLAKLSNPSTLSVDNTNVRTGIGSTIPTATLDVGGTVSISSVTASTSTSTGALVVDGGVGIAKSLFIGEGLSVGGTITYDDVTNIDSVGIVTAGKGVRVTTGGITMIGVATMGAVGASGTTLHVHGDGRVTGVLTAGQFSGVVGGVGIPGIATGGHTVLTTVNVSGVSTLATSNITTVNVGAGITLTASGIINAGFTTITGATETCTGVTTYPTPDSSSTKVTIECDASKGTLFSHDMSNGNVGIVSLTNLPVRGNSFTTYTILFTQLSSTPVGKGNTLPKNGIGTNVYLDGGFTGFTTRGRVASASTVTLSTTASDLDIVTLGVHYNGSGTGGKENFKVYVSGDTGYRIGND